MELYDFIEKLQRYARDNKLEDEFVEVQLQGGILISGFHFDGNTGLILEVED